MSDEGPPPVPDDVDLDDLDGQLSHHIRIIERCAVEVEGHGPVLLATPAQNRYPYVYPRDCSCAAQLFRRLAGSKHGYDAGPRAFELLRSTASFMKAVQAPDGSWGQRYSLEGEDKAIYVQEDNVAHGISIICNYLLTAAYLEKDIDDLEGCLDAINRGLVHALENFFHADLNLFESTTAIHESQLERGYTIWVNLSFLFAFSLADEVNTKLDAPDLIDDRHLEFRKQFLYTVNELFMEGQRYVRRIDTRGHIDRRPDVTLLSPFYYGFMHYKDEQRNAVEYLATHLRDPTLGGVMRYLPFRRDPGVHVHAGNGPWLSYTAILAQYYYWDGQRERGDQVLEEIRRYCDDAGEIPEHLSTCRRFDTFMEQEWQTGADFNKEFDPDILLPDTPFDLILEEANNMRRSYQETDEGCNYDEAKEEGGYTQFARPLMWSHVEYARALLVKAGDWWNLWT